MEESSNQKNFIVDSEGNYLYSSNSDEQILNNNTGTGDDKKVDLEIPSKLFDALNNVFSKSKSENKISKSGSRGNIESKESIKISKSFSELENSGSSRSSITIAGGLVKVEVAKDERPESDDEVKSLNKEIIAITNFGITKIMAESETEKEEADSSSEFINKNDFIKLTKREITAASTYTAGEIESINSCLSLTEKSLGFSSQHSLTMSLSKDSLSIARDSFLSFSSEDASYLDELQQYINRLYHAKLNLVNSGTGPETKMDLMKKNEIYKEWVDVNTTHNKHLIAKLEDLTEEVESKKDLLQSKIESASKLAKEHMTIIQEYEAQVNDLLAEKEGSINEATELKENIKKLETDLSKTKELEENILQKEKKILELKDKVDTHRIKYREALDIINKNGYKAEILDNQTKILDKHLREKEKEFDRLQELVKDKNELIFSLESHIKLLQEKVLGYEKDVPLFDKSIQVVPNMLEPLHPSRPRSKNQITNKSSTNVLKQALPVPVAAKKSKSKSKLNHKEAQVQTIEMKKVVESKGKQQEEKRVKFVVHPASHHNSQQRMFYSGLNLGNRPSWNANFGKLPSATNPFPGQNQVQMTTPPVQQQKNPASSAIDNSYATILKRQEAYQEAQLPMSRRPGIEAAQRKLKEIERKFQEHQYKIERRKEFKAIQLEQQSLAYRRPDKERRPDTSESFKNFKSKNKFDLDREESVFIVNKSVYPDNRFRDPFNHWGITYSNNPRMNQRHTLNNLKNFAVETTREMLDYANNNPNYNSEIPGFSVTVGMKQKKQKTHDNFLNFNNPDSSSRDKYENNFDFHTSNSIPDPDPFEDALNTIPKVSNTDFVKNWVKKSNPVTSNLSHYKTRMELLQMQDNYRFPSRSARPNFNYLKKSAGAGMEENTEHENNEFNGSHMDLDM